MVKLEPYRGDYYLWEYVPSMAASIVFLLLFLAATAYHTWQAWKTKARFCIPFVIGGLCMFLPPSAPVSTRLIPAPLPTVQVIGYGARADCTNKTAQLMPYIIQSVFILLAPVLYAASIYMFLARLLISVAAEKYSLIRIQWLTKTFVAGDIISFLIQGTGAGLMAMDGMASMAKGIILVFGFFMATSFVFERRMKRVPLAAESAWKRYLYPLYAVSGLIMVRSLFRVVEYAMGNKGYLLANEWPLYVFDSVLMWAVMVIWGYWHPGTIRQEVQSTHSQLLSMTSFQSKV
ncbi:RTA1 like protein-domain-containing protein [Aspergillus karnatakaensis]|uniref:RTA1 domain-containing protein n=1 Tax=Aspergillus karnatakaensis TaxID=1810916 RepID=UPI003CCE04E1